MSSGFSSSSSIQSLPVASLPKVEPSAARNETSPVVTPPPASTPSVATIRSAASPGIRSSSAKFAPSDSSASSFTTMATSTLPYWRSTSPSSASTTRSETNPVAAKNATPVMIATSVAT